MPDTLVPTAERVLGCITLDAAGIDSANRSRIQVFPGPGEYTHPRSGKFTITADDLEAWREDINARGDQIPVDYDHSFAMGAGSKAAGWFVPGSALLEDGALYADVEWTPDAADDIRNKRYRFISPEFAFQFKGQDGKTVRKPRLFAAALTNRPFFSQMPPVMIADEGLAELLAGGRYITSEEFELLARVTDPVKRDELLAALQSSDHETRTTALTFLTTTKETTMPDIKALAESVGLTADASEEDILAALAAKASKTDELETKVAELQAKAPTDQAMTALLASAAKGEEAVKRLDEMERDSAIEKAIADMKILPAEKETYLGFWAIDPAGTAKLLADKAVLPISPTHQRTVLNVTDFELAEGTTDTPAYVAVGGTEIPVEASTAQIHEKAIELLTAAGKGDSYTGDEYVAAAKRAARELGLSFLGDVGAAAARRG